MVVPLTAASKASLLRAKTGLMLIFYNVTEVHKGFVLVAFWWVFLFLECIFLKVVAFELCL